jgi:hypothetical protein
MIEIARISHYDRVLIVPISRAFQYFSNIESYTTWYPDYCKRVDILEKSSDGNDIKTKEFWNISINNDIDHVILYVNYTFFPSTGFQYEIRDSSCKKSIGIKNGILLEQRENNQTAINGNNVVLGVVCFPPHSQESQSYEELIDYFVVKDCIHLENKPIEPFREGQLCTKCYKDRLQAPRTKEIYEENGYKRKIVFWECDRCGFQWLGTHVQVS